MPRNRAHYRVTVADALAAHGRALNVSGGHRGIHESGRIEAAVNRPYSGYYKPIHKKAAVLVDGVVSNHGFVDGNKRTALMLCYLFLEKSGWKLQQTSTRQDEDDLEHLILDLTTHFLTLEETMEWFKHRLSKI